MALTRRYSPEMAPNEGSMFGMDFSAIIPPGVGISLGQCAAWRNAFPRVPAPLNELVVGNVQIVGRTLIAFIEAFGPAQGNDYQLEWTAFDTQGNVWPRTGLLLVSPTS